METKEHIKELIYRYVAEYQSRDDNVIDVYQPIVKFGDVNHEKVKHLKTIASQEHLSPFDLVEDATIFISYFIPFKEQLSKSNSLATTTSASKEWAMTYNDVNTMMLNLNEYLVMKLKEMGYNAEFSRQASDINEEIMSNWSHRHIGWISGLGTFGINNMLITEKGSCGRMNSLVTNLDIVPDQQIKEEYCLNKINGICNVCINRCPINALSKEGFKRGKCQKHLESHGGTLVANVCGQCVVELPCSFKVPLAKI